jgi:hypothetical protein
VLKPFADNHDWLLVNDVVYRFARRRRGDHGAPGLHHRFCQHSAGVLSADLSPNGRYSKAAIVHDYLY